MLKKITVRFALLILLASVLITGCRGGSDSTNGPDLTPVAGYEWLVADGQPVNPGPAMPRNNGPEDWRDEIIYMIMTDRFADGNKANNAPAPYYNRTNLYGYHGGDLAGIKQHADYIRSLGATAIWITPPVENTLCEDGGKYPYYASYHGYAARDFQRLDPFLVDDMANNGMDDYRNFVDAMHSEGLMVIQDIVVNHMGQLTVFPNESNIWTQPFNPNGYYMEFLEDHIHDSWVTTERRHKPSAPFNNIDFFTGCGSIRENSWQTAPENQLGDFNNLRDLNTRSTAVQDALVNVYKNYIANAGVDGFRIDTVLHVEEPFWDVFCPGVRQAVGGKKFFQFGEVWVADHNLISRYSLNQRIDSMLNFEFYYAVIDVFTKGQATSRLRDELERRFVYRQAPITGGGAELAADDGLVNFIDNHDNARFMTSAGGNRALFWNALTYLMTAKGIPCIYYNTENEATGSGYDMGIEGRSDMRDFNTNGKRTFTLLRKLAKIRKENVALRRGEMTVLKDSATPGIFAFVRHTGIMGKNVFVFVNTSPHSITETINLGSHIDPDSNLRNTLYAEFNQEDVITVNGTLITVTIPPNNTKIYVVQ